MPAFSAAAATQSAVFHDGRFQVLQARARGAYTTLVLRGGNFRRVRALRRSFAAAGAKKKPPPVRRLWGNGQRRFRTKGKYSSATVRGTNWLVSDRCDGTFTYVRQGRVAVRDPRPAAGGVLIAGQSYLARRP